MEQIYDVINFFNDELNELLLKIQEKDSYTNGHSIRVMDYSVKISNKLNYSNISHDDIVIASLFHDVGKCFIPDEILLKTTRLDSTDWRCIMKHPIDSRRILEPKFSTTIANLAQMHHERLDGSGYPYGLTSEDIPIEARIIAVADSFDAMTSKRVYSEPKSFDVAVSELLSLTHLYDKEVTQVLSLLVKEGKIARK